MLLTVFHVQPCANTNTTANYSGQLTCTMRLCSSLPVTCTRATVCKYKYDSKLQRTAHLHHAPMLLTVFHVQPIRAGGIHNLFPGPLRACAYQVSCVCVFCVYEQSIELRPSMHTVIYSRTHTCKHWTHTNTHTNSHTYTQGVCMPPVHAPTQLPGPQPKRILAGQHCFPPYLGQHGHEQGVHIPRVHCFCVLLDGYSIPINKGLP